MKVTRFLACLAAAGALFGASQPSFAQTPAEFYKAAQGFLVRPHDMAAELRTATKDATVISRLAA